MPLAIRLALGAMALWGTVYALAALAGDFAVVTSPLSGRVAPSGIEAFVIHVHAFVALAILLIEAWIALNLPSMPVSKRVAWVFAMMFFYPLAIPAFWYLHIWRGSSARKPPSLAEPR